MIDAGRAGECGNPVVRLDLLRQDRTWRGGVHTRADLRKPLRNGRACFSVRSREGTNRVGSSSVSETQVARGSGAAGRSGDVAHGP